LDEARRQVISLRFPLRRCDRLAERERLRPNDVAIIGGGLAGTAASIHLVRAGLSVLCIEADLADTAPVGESLDWSAPDLLAALGLPMQRLIDEGFGIWKRHVTLKLADGRPPS